MPRTVRTLVAGTTAAVALVLAPGTASGHVPGGAGASAGTPAAQVWMTTVDRSEQLTRRADVPFSFGGSDELTVTVDPSRTYQEMDGFGASITDSSAVLLAALPRAKRDEVMRSLFSRDGGIALGFLRQPMGASDFVAGPHYTYDDLPAGETDYDLSEFTVAHDEAQILPLLRQALALNPAIKVMGTPWSPPAWMKDNQSLVGGRLIDDDRIYATYAQYFVRFIQAYQAAGVPVQYVTVQNEPQNRTPGGYPGMDMPVADQVRLISVLGPALRDAGLKTQIIGYDHNWATHPNDLTPESLPPGRDPEPDYAADVLSSEARRWVAGTAFHCYYGDPSAMTALHNRFPDKGIWFTECSGSHGPSDPPAQVFADTLKWHSRNVTLGTTRNWAKSVVNWNLALDPSGGPHNGGCGSCTGVVTVATDGTVTRNAEYYTLGHMSKFVQPDAMRIASSNYGTTGWNGQIMNVAFRNPDGSVVLVAHNENDNPRTFAVAMGDQHFEYTLPGAALATFVWPASKALRSKFDLLDITGATATASPTGDNPGALVDDDASSRWSAGTAQVPGQYFTIDLGRKVHASRVVLDAGAAAGNPWWAPTGNPSSDYARSWELYTSLDGSTWTRVATGLGTGQLTTIDVGMDARFLRVVNTGTAGNWWSVADVRLYR
ncbi:MAG: glycoside hydrolase family 30 beta sandwich domain-containing protein [Mycobacteriales bacterium]